MGLLSMQGISDQIAWGYIAKWGNATYADVGRRLATTRCACPKLRSFAAFTGCGYRKGQVTCARPQHLRLCPVRQLPLRKGLLNIQAVSLHRWLTDVCGGDLVAWIDRVIAAAKASTKAGAEVASSYTGMVIMGDEGPGGPSVGPPGQVEGTAGGRTGSPGATSLPSNAPWVHPAKAALVTSLTAVEGVSDKLTNMTLAALMIGGRPKDPDWFAVATQMLTVDSLIHNMLERTGVLAAFQAEHRYGPGCYGVNGCEAAIHKVTEALDGHMTSPVDATSPSLQPIMSIATSPTTGSADPPTPIEVQKALWRFCTAGVLDHCNAAQVGRGTGCHHAAQCPVAQNCARATSTDQRGPMTE